MRHDPAEVDTRAALAALHADCYGWALACCGRDRELALEALQGAYLRILDGRARFRGRSSFRTFVFGVIRLTAREERRRTRLRLLGAAGPTDAAGLPDASPLPDAAALAAERRARLLAALARLSPRQREVLELVFYHGMTVEEAARVMGVRLGSARRHYERGKARLRALLPGLRGSTRDADGDG
jgi:RNA polymerase sigma factor (sigma-70 family)